MKRIITIAVMLMSIGVNAQTEWKNICLDKSCVNDIASAALITKLLKVDDSQYDYNINIYDDNNKGELQLWYTKGLGQLKRIVGTWATIDKIYQSYFGRTYDATVAATKGDIWKAKFNNKNIEIRLTKMERANYWRMDIIERK